MSLQPNVYRPLPELPRIEITNHSAATYEAAFTYGLKMLGEIRQRDGYQGPIEVADIGAGESDFYSSGQDTGRVITRIDPAYAYYQPRGDGVVAADARHMPEIPTATFDATVSSFLMQHLKEPGEVSASLLEMIRVTKPEQAGGGVSLIYPVYSRAKLNDAIAREGAGDIAWLVPTDDAKLSDRGLPISTLLITKKTEIDAERYTKLTEAIEGSGALSRRRHVGDMIRDIRMRAWGRRDFRTRSRHD